MEQASNIPTVDVAPNTFEWYVVKRYREQRNIRIAFPEEIQQMSADWKTAYINSDKIPLGNTNPIWDRGPYTRNGDTDAKNFKFTWRTEDGKPITPSRFTPFLCKWPTQATRQFIAENAYLVTNEDKKTIEVAKAMSAAPVRVVEKKTSNLLLVSALRGQLKS